MDRLTAFGLVAVTAMVVCYALERRSRWYILGFAVACALGSVYGFLQGAWPFGAVEAVWTFVALWRWHHAAAILPRNAGEGDHAKHGGGGAARAVSAEEALPPPSRLR